MSRIYRSSFILLQGRCDMPKEQGPCVNYMTRWYFNRDSQRCEPFTYGGCQGNRNKFLTEVECAAECGRGDTVVATDPPSPSTPPTPSPVQPTAGENFCAILLVLFIPIFVNHPVCMGPLLYCKLSE